MYNLQQDLDAVVYFSLVTIVVFLIVASCEFVLNRRKK